MSCDLPRGTRKMNRVRRERPRYPTIDPRILGEAGLSFLILGHGSKHTSVEGQCIWGRAGYVFEEVLLIPYGNFCYFRYSANIGTQGQG